LAGTTGRTTGGESKGAASIPNATTGDLFLFLVFGCCFGGGGGVGGVGGGHEVIIRLDYPSLFRGRRGKRTGKGAKRRRQTKSKTNSLRKKSNAEASGEREKNENGVGDQIETIRTKDWRRARGGGEAEK